MLRRLIHAWRERRALARRQIFEYHDGTHWRYADPFAVWRHLFHHPTVDILAVLPFAEQGKEPEASIALGVLCEVFGVQRWDEATRTGLTDLEILGLVVQFQVYLGSLKKSTDDGPISSPPLASASSPSPEPPPPATSEPLGSGSASIGSTPAADGTSCEPSKAPSPDPSGSSISGP